MNTHISFGDSINRDRGLMIPNILLILNNTKRCFKLAMKTGHSDHSDETKLLSASDRKILRLLQTDGRLSNQELAEKIGLSKSACWRRVKALEEAGIIEGYAAKLNPKACGLGFHAIVHVMLARHHVPHLQQFTDEIITRDEVLDCYSTTGGADYHLRVRCADIESYNQFLDSFLFSLEGIASIQTHMVLRELKHTDRLSLAS